MLEPTDGADLLGEAQHRVVVHPLGQEALHGHQAIDVVIARQRHLGLAAGAERSHRLVARLAGQHQARHAAAVLQG